MTKIKNFRIPLRTRDMARWLKKERGLETTPELEIAIESMAKEARPWLEPAALYTTLTRQIAEKTTTLSFPDKAIAVSLIAVSIGQALEAQRLAAQEMPTRETLLAAVQQEALAQALQFAVRLVQDQAKEEDCDMSPPIFSPDLFTSSTLPALLGVQRIGLAFDAATQTLPPYARVAWLFWTPVGKGASRRGSSSTATAEKVAA